MGSCLNILGIDPATHSGYTFLEVTKSSINLKWTKMYAPPKKVKGMEKLAYIGGELNNILQINKPDLVVIEGYSWASKHAIVTMAEIGTIYRYFMWQLDQKYIEVPPTSLKKFMGKGNLKKDMMRLSAYKHFGFEHESDDVVDSFCLAMFGAYSLGQFPLLKYQQDAIKGTLPKDEQELWLLKHKKKLKLNGLVKPVKPTL